LDGPLDGLVVDAKRASYSRLACPGRNSAYNRCTRKIRQFLVFLTTSRQFKPNFI
jgi:hypothetical protein